MLGGVLEGCLPNCRRREGKPHNMAPPGVDCSINPGASAYVDRRVSETQPDHADTARPFRPSYDPVRPFSPSYDPVRPCRPSYDPVRPFRHSQAFQAQSDHADTADHSDIARPCRHSQTMQIQPDHSDTNTPRPCTQCDYADTARSRRYFQTM